MSNEDLLKQIEELKEELTNSQKTQIALVICVSALGVECLEGAVNPTWQQALDILQKMKDEKNELLALLLHARNKFDDYEMGQEELPPFEHRKLMGNIDSAIRRLAPKVTP